MCCARPTFLRFLDDQPGGHFQCQNVHAVDSPYACISQDRLALRMVALWSSNLSGEGVPGLRAIGVWSTIAQTLGMVCSRGGCASTGEDILFEVRHVQVAMVQDRSGPVGWTLGFKSPGIQTLISRGSSQHDDSARPSRTTYVLLQMLLSVVLGTLPKVVSSPQV